ncbi:MAG: hydroxyacylglutathione hydrolase [Rhizobiaceae bacterium]
MNSSARFHQFPCLDDNYGVLVNNPESGETIAVDAPDGAAVLEAAHSQGWKITHLLITHHHGDHIQGLAEVKGSTGCQVIGPANPAISGIDKTVADGDRLTVAGFTVEVIATPGHTLDMLNFHFPQLETVFTGDTLFAMGCGRVFEGTNEMMWASLEKLTKLPPQTSIYCGHEYTLSNARFSLTVDGTNSDLQARLKEVEAMRAKGMPTIPTSLALELKTNPFLRAADPAIRANLGMANATNGEVFAEIRERKNRG